MLQPKITLKDSDLDVSNMAMDVCCEKDCNIPVMVDKDMKEKGRQTRCTSCFMRFKIRSNQKR